ncbi:MAG: GyrI-like domain-containing protein [Ardenticatenaceae bacterium]|nr:GyrI-like domain-containing protein [Ardenticatenaceae bacterium]MCB8989515.1 GyrI-like domain-containing protein [Ardenticatenaceae bacterium]MCB9003059.1 GyrI-like domain-containing protein [Ardenticatenaceae bacterium]
MEKVDYKKELKHLYRPSAKVVTVVDVPEMTYLMIDGTGNPNTTPFFQEATEALFAVSYQLKFMIKKGEQPVDYGVMPLEGLWWADDMTQFNVEKKGDWLWTLMMMQPTYVTPALYAEAIAQVKKKKNPAALPLMRLTAYAEGQSAQIMHLGPFSEEGPTIARLHDFIASNGSKISGKHHEIYLSDIRRAAPEKWKTVIRQPFR